MKKFQNTFYACKRALIYSFAIYMIVTRNTKWITTTNLKNVLLYENIDHGLNFYGKSAF